MNLPSYFLVTIINQEESLNIKRSGHIIHPTMTIRTIVWLTACGFCTKGGSNVIRGLPFFRKPLRLLGATLIGAGVGKFVSDVEDDWHTNMKEYMKPYPYGKGMTIREELKSYQDMIRRQQV